MRNGDIATALSLLLLVPCVAGLTGCKPTERNYQAAYEMARAKRETKDPDAALIYGQAKVHTFPGVSERVVDGDTLLTSYMVVRPFEGESFPEGRPIRVAVASFRMKANAVAFAEDLRKDGFDAFCGEGTGDRFLTFGGAFPTLKEGAAFVKRYRESGRPMVGLEEGAILIY